MLRIIQIVALICGFARKGLGIANNSQIIVDNAFFHLDGKTYLIWNQYSLSWFEARDFCNKLNMDLVNFENANKQHRFANFVRRQGWTYQGNRRIDYVYWTSRKNSKDNTTKHIDWEGIDPELNRDYWLFNEVPAGTIYIERCMAMGFNAFGSWLDKPCHVKYHFICVYPAAARKCPITIKQPTVLKTHHEHDHVENVMDDDPPKKREPPSTTEATTKAPQISAQCEKKPDITRIAIGDEVFQTRCSTPISTTDDLVYLVCKATKNH